jgi:PD-(D/E)XK endonuclease
MQTTDQKGAIAEMAIAWEATRQGIEVYRPLSEGGRFDMIFLLGDQLARVQCKWAPRLGDAIVVRCYSCRRAREKGYEDGSIAPSRSMRSRRTAPDNGRCHYLPIDWIGGRRQILLRLAPTQNNQRLGIHWAEDFEFAATLPTYDGAIAQLGERRRGTPKVAGSSPAGSTLFLT